MSTPGIEFKGIWKKFQRGELHDSLRDLVPAVSKRLLGRGPSGEDLSGGEFWALRNVTFNVEPGQVLGIIGPNGAGKSTTLKVLNRILKPNRGQCVIRGRVGALIELAAGFHNDLTGRENIFLQGAIMGMRRREIAKRFDEIVEFSGIEEFLDTPVKRYSSGMNARLGFSIAAHMNPDVLLIDEVLSVGDLSFQGKAFRHLKELAGRGMPVVVVSHQLERVATLCTNAVLLKRGEVVHQGSPQDCIAAYVLDVTGKPSLAESNSPVELEQLSVHPRDGVTSGERIKLAVKGRTVKDGRLDDLNGVSVRVRSAKDGRIVYASSTHACGLDLPISEFEVEIDLQMNVAPGVYVLETGVYDRNLGRYVAWGPSAKLEVKEGSVFWGSVQMNPCMRLLSERS